MLTAMEMSCFSVLDDRKEEHILSLTIAICDEQNMIKCKVQGCLLYTSDAADD